MMVPFQDSSPYLYPWTFVLGCVKAAFFISKLSCLMFYCIVLYGLVQFVFLVAVLLKIQFSYKICINQTFCSFAADLQIPFCLKNAKES